MLVLSRQRDETIMIGDEVEITVVDVRGDKVRIGISAPAKIAVHRKEVYEAIQRENQQAARLEGAVLGEIDKDNKGGAPVRAMVPSPAPLNSAVLTPRVGAQQPGSVTRKAS